MIIAQQVRDKLAQKHRVDEVEIVQCFANRTGKYLKDTREEHKPTCRRFGLLLKQTREEH